MGYVVGHRRRRVSGALDGVVRHQRFPDEHVLFAMTEEEFNKHMEDATARSVFWSAYAVFITVIAVALAINLW
jgi:hypothetical protein